MKTDIHPLRRWLFENQMTLTAFGAKTGIAASHLSEIINRKKLPSFEAMDKISHATKGAVMANDFQTYRPGKSGR